MLVNRCEGASLEKTSDGKLKHLQLSITQMEVVQCGVTSWPVNEMGYKC